MRILQSYPTFKEFSLLDHGFVDEFCELRNEQLEDLFRSSSAIKTSSFPSLVSKLSSDQHKYLLLRKEVVSNPDVSTERAIANLRKRCDYFHNKGEEAIRYLLVSLSQELCESFLGYCPQGQIDEGLGGNAPILISAKPFQDVHHVSLLVSVVPIKSIFTLYIVSMINDLLKTLIASQGTSKTEAVSVKLQLLTSPTAYRTVLDELLSTHLGYTGNADDTFQALRPLFESEFQSMVSKLILRARWQDDEKWRSQKMAVLRKMQFVTEEDISKHINKIDTNVALGLDNLKDKEMWGLLLRGGIDRFIHPQVQGDLITAFILYIMQKGVEDDEILAITLPLPDGLVLDILLNAMLSSKDPIYKKFKHTLERTYILAYLPYPLNPIMLQELPFYFSPYSELYYSRESSKRGTAPSSISLEEDKGYVFKVTRSAVEKLDLEMATGWNKYDAMLRGVTTLFRIVENEIAEDLRYIF